MRWKDFFPNFGGCAKNQSTRAMAHLGVLLRFRGSVTHPESIGLQDHAKISKSEQHQKFRISEVSTHSRNRIQHIIAAELPS